MADAPLLAAERTLDGAVAVEDQVDALTSLAVLLADRDPVRGADVARAAVAGALAAGDELREARARQALGRNLVESSAFGESLEEQLAALQVFERARDDAGAADCLVLIGVAHGYAGDAAAALAFLERGLALHRTTGSPAGLARAINEIANVQATLGHRDDADELYRQAMELFETAGDDLWAGYVLVNMAENRMNAATAAAGQGDRAAARLGFERGLALLEEAAATAPDAPALRAFVAVARAAGQRGLGEHERALETYAEAQALAEAVGERRVAATCAIGSAEVRVALGQAALAAAELRAAVAELDGGGLPAEAAEAERALAHALEAQGDHKAALETFRRFHARDVEARGAAAERQARLLLVQLETEQARHEAERYRRQTSELQTANASLRAQAAELDRRANEDALTALANRRLFDARLVEMVGRAAEEGWTLALALLDVDRFKLVNDRYSHLTGDEVLRTVAGLVAGACRRGDVVARYGGEEFAILLPASDANRAGQTCERIRRAVESHPWGTLARGLAVTLSAGAATTAETDGLVGLVATADARLYAAKRGGRNRVVVDAAAAA